jgi:phenylalanyl-tRNA synthetase alpha chain
MGFTEMDTSRYVESSFWNFDSLFQPQSHPARDMHDTFFLKKPELCPDIPADYMQAVKEIHSKGGFGSKGYNTEWEEGEARKNLLRTHTTAVSSRMLYNLAQNIKKGKEFKPVKYFSIDRVFRNETLDATHLAEFHQCEGLVADRGIGLSNLMGTIAAFFKKIGVKKIKYKPAFNPYTEPSLEIFGYHPTLKRWVEIGNSGIFRPEMLRPMGLPEDVNVIAWGLSLERPTMIHYNLNNIRDLFGHKVALSSTRNNTICYIVPDEEEEKEE